MKFVSEGHLNNEKDHETLILGDFNTIFGGFYGGGTSTSSRKLYNRNVEARKSESITVPSLCFAASDSEDVFPHEDNPIVMSIITMSQIVHRILVDQGSSTDVMYWETFLGLHIPLDQL